MIDLGRYPQLARPEKLVLYAVEVEGVLVGLYVFGGYGTSGSAVAQPLILVLEGGHAGLLRLSADLQDVLGQLLLIHTENFH